jgi:beta-phosphoglucomutase-like phosphatase (HAD superfamily)
MKTEQYPTFIFDLDGVITKTEAYHFEAWKETAAFLE